MIRLSILIVTWNVGEQLAACLRSLDANRLPADWEIIIFDNASRDDTAALVRKTFPQVRLVESPHNLGYAAGNNRAAAAAQGEYLLLLNPDTLASREAIAGLLDFMDAHSRAGACSPQLRLADGSVQPFTFGEDPTPGYLFRRGWRRLIHHQPLHDWETPTSHPVAWVSGAAMMVRRAAWEQVGGFDENFFMYFEDNDLCLRMRKRGWEIWYHPAVAITHLGGQSAQQMGSSGSAYRASLRYFYRKHYGWAARGLLWLGLAAYHGIQTMGRWQASGS